MSRTGGEQSTPRAIIHKRILDAAESEPDASMTEIADGIGGASTELVERVLEQYGDPAEDQQESRADTQDPQEVTMDEHDSQNEQGETASTTDGSVSEARADENGRRDVDRSELTERQLKTLRLIDEVPDASQSDLAEEFDVTRVTISRRLNDIPGFDWSRRREIASEILNGGDLRETNEQEQSGQSGGREQPEQSNDREGSGQSDERERSGQSAEPETLDRRLDALERRVDEIETTPDDQVETTPDASSPGIGPELAHKVVHAAMTSDLIDEEEELRLLRELMR
ncbi:hypothetical protein BRC93_16325 [Halobacteriales archaeon QS_5_70_15]|nr:MAG: hypothetical protein BRC93_16325 [Halobacteriales archaeon QS_5_70_15]